MAVNYVSLALDVLIGGTQYPQGTAYTAPTAPVMSSGNELYIPSTPNPASLAAGYRTVIPLAATDNTGFSPSGWGWTLTWSVNPPVSGPPSINFYLPYGPFPFTATNASPAVFTWSDPNNYISQAFPYGVPNGTVVRLDSGAPAGFFTTKNYYVVSQTSSTFELAATPDGAPVASAGTGSGNWHIVQANYSSLTPQTIAPILLGPPVTSVNEVRPDVSGNVNFTAAGLGALAQSANLSDLANAATARTNLGLGSAATQDSSAFIQAANNLSDLANEATARTNLGLGSAATQDSSAFIQAANNLSDLANEATARTNLGLGSAATQDSSAFIQAANNLSDLANEATARTNLGLGSAATQSSSAFDAAGSAATAQANAEAASDPTGSAATAQANAETYADTNKLAKSANLSDLANAATARTNLGLGSAATQASSAFDAAGSAATAQANAETYADTNKLAKSANLSDLANAATARTNLGLGSAATQASSAFDAAGSAATAQANAEAASDPTGSAATAQANAETYADTNKLAKSANLSDLANAATARTNLGLGSAATQASSAFDAAGSAATAQANAETYADTNKLAKSANLSDLANAATARTNLGLGSAATQASSAFDAAGSAATAQANAEAASDPTGSAATAQANAETYADTNKLAKSANLSDLANAATARTNLGLGSAATQASSAFDAAGSAATAQANAETYADTNKLAKSANLSDLANAATARTNLGLGSAATQASSAFDAAGSAATAQANAETYADTNKLAKSANLSDLANAATARTNLGLGSAATQASSAFDAAGSAATAQANAETYADTNKYAKGVQASGINGWFNVKDAAYGATGNGTTDDTAAIQAAINAATGAAAPATHTRQALAPVYLPPGNYKISADLIIRSVSGFRLVGDGPANTTITCSGAGFTTAGILIDGSLDGIFEGFLLAGDTTEQVTDGIRLDFTSAAQRSTTGNSFKDIRIRGLKFVTGISLEGNGSAQVDGTNFENIVITGQQVVNAWSNSGNWQAGIAFGNGTFANNYDHVGVGVNVAQCYYGYKINGSSFSLDGAQPANNFSDFWIVPGAQCSIRNIQSQTCNQFLTTASSFAPIPVSFEDITIKTNYLNAGLVVANIYGGTWHFKNFSATNVQTGNSGTYILGQFNITGASSTRPAFVTFDNLSMNGARTSCIVPTSGQAEISVRNYANYTPTTGNYVAPATGDLLSLYTGSAWVNLDTLPQITWVTTPGTTTYTIPAGAQTIEIVLQGGGGGGGAGALTASAAAGGGAGGNGGGYSLGTFVAADLGASVSLTVGAAGTAASPVSSAGSGGNGGSGGQTIFGSAAHATGGGGGNGGTSVAGGTASVTVGLGNDLWGGIGGAGNATTTGGNGVGVTTTTALLNGASGGAGGAGTTGAASANGGTAQIPVLGSSVNFGSGGVAGGASPGSGTQPAVKGIPSCGGGGGASAFGAATTAQTGATAFYGGGGGGGGGCSAGTSSGGGGSGGPGFALIIAHFQ